MYEYVFETAKHWLLLRRPSTDAMTWKKFSINSFCHIFSTRFSLKYWFRFYLFTFLVSFVDWFSRTGGRALEDVFGRKLPGPQYVHNDPLRLICPQGKRRSLRDVKSLMTWFAQYVKSSSKPHYHHHHHHHCHYPHCERLDNIMICM